MTEESYFLYHEPCPQCSSSDGFAVYTDGHRYCFVCQHYEKGGSAPSTRRTPLVTNGPPLIEAGEYRELRKRRLSASTAQHFGYGLGEYKGRPVQIAPYYDRETGQLCAQKIRFPDKDFIATGDIKRAGLFGHQLWTSAGRMVVVTEGEIDALTVSQLQGNKWPVVSVPGGAPGAKKALAANLEWLLKYETVVLCFDNDEAGQSAYEECAPLFPPGRCKIARLPLKDANEMLVTGRGEEVMRAVWNAQPYRPASVVTVDDIYEEALKPIEWGLDWPWPALTEATFGIQRGRVYLYGAGTGIGKSDVFAQVAAHTRQKLGCPVGMISLEQAPTETLNRLAGKIAGKAFHVPDGSWTEEERKVALTELRDLGGIYFRNQWGMDDWQDVAQWIRWLVVSEGVKDIFLDHLTGLATGGDESESDTLKRAMAELASLAKELDFSLHIVSHLNTPEGKPHEEGGRVMIRHFRGSRAIGYWSHFMFALERDTQEQDQERRHITTFRVLKDRLSGRGTGTTFGLRYDPATGLLNECELPSNDTTSKSHGFSDETGGDDF